MLGIKKKKKKKNVATISLMDPPESHKNNLDSTNIIFLNTKK